MVSMTARRIDANRVALAAFLLAALLGFAARATAAQVVADSGPRAEVTALRNRIETLSVRASEVMSRVDPKQLTTAQALRARDRLSAAIQVAAGAGSIGDAASLVAIRDELEQAIRAFETLVGLAGEHQPPTSLLRAANAFFEGHYEQAIELLEAARYDDNESNAYARLLSGAAKFSLYRLGGDRDRNLISAAREDVRAAARLRPGLVPTEAHFSPEFVKFYVGNAGK